MWEEGRRAGEGQRCVGGIEKGGGRVITWVVD